MQSFIHPESQPSQVGITLQNVAVFICLALWMLTCLMCLSRVSCPASELPDLARCQMAPHKAGVCQCWVLT
jgi:hypothetical protein